MRLWCFPLPLLLGLPAAAVPADLARIDRAIKAEPTYVGRPHYCLLIFGLQTKTRVWIVLDGDTLHVDRNADGDLTGPGKAVRAETKDDCKIFSAGTIAAGNLMHTNLTVYANRLGRWVDVIGDTPGVRELAREPNPKL
jgi:hypothetical protein